MLTNIVLYHSHRYRRHRYNAIIVITRTYLIADGDHNETLGRFGHFSDVKTAAWLLT